MLDLFEQNKPQHVRSKVTQHKCGHVTETLNTWYESWRERKVTRQYVSGRNATNPDHKGKVTLSACTESYKPLKLTRWYGRSFPTVTVTDSTPYGRYCPICNIPGTYTTEAWDWNYPNTTEITSGGPVPAFLGLSPLQLQNNVKLAEKIRVSSAEWGEALAEFNKTAKMLANIALGVLHALTKLKKGNVVGAAHELNRLIRNPKVRKKNLRNARRALRRNGRWTAEQWLQYRFGLSPLGGMIEDGLDSLQNLIEAQPDLIAETVAVTRKSQEGVCGYRRKGPYIQLAVCKTGARWKSKMNVPAITPAEGLALAWELVPLSVIVDYFWTAGEYLASLGHFSSCIWLEGYYSQLNKIQLTGTTPPGGVNSNNSVPRFCSTYVDFVRDVLRTPPGTIPESALQQKWYKQTDQVSLNRFLDIAASARVFFGAR